MKNSSWCWIAVFAAACGGGGVVPDASLDAPVTGPVTLTIQGFLGPAAGARVLFQDRESIVVADVTTDAAGRATAEMASGGFVTAIDPLGAAIKDLRTFSNVEPGDQLAIAASSRRLGSVQVRIPRDTVLSVTDYYVHDSCHETAALIIPTEQGTGPLQVTGDLCDGATDIVVTPYVGTTAQPRSIVKSNVTLSDGMLLDLSAEPYLPTYPTRYQFSGVANPTVAGTSVLRVAPSGMVASTAVTRQGTDLESGELPDLPGAADLLIASGDVVVIDVQPASALHSVDLGTAIVPTISGLAFDPTRRAVTWTTGSGAPADVTLGQLRVQRGAQVLVWALEGRHTPGQLDVPVLPADLATWNPDPGEPVEIEIVVARVPGGHSVIAGDPHLVMLEYDRVSRLVLAIRARASQITGVVSIRDAAAN